MEHEKLKIGLALSGGGYRATIYHLGTFKKLKELGILEKIDVISSNSGGSITGACYSLHHNDFKEFEKIITEGVRKSIVIRVLFSLRFIIPIILWFGFFTARYWLPFDLPSYVFTSVNILATIGIVLFQFYILPISKIIERKYDAIFFNKKTLADFSTKFRTTIISTNIETGTLFSFSRDKMTDSTYDYRYLEDGETKYVQTFKNKNFPIARAVIASSCVPFAFTPIKIKKKYFVNATEYKMFNPKLVDGGVYDNQGIHKLTFKKSSSYCENVIVSDAGNFLPIENWSFNSLFLLIRVSSVFMSRIKNFQMMDNLYSKHTNSIVAYQSLGFDLERSIDEFMSMLKSGYIKVEVITAHKIDLKHIENKDWEAISKHLKTRINYEEILTKGCNKNELELARSVRTGLSSLSTNKITALTKHAEVITELQVKLFLPHLL